LSTSSRRRATVKSFPSRRADTPAARSGPKLLVRFFVLLLNFMRLRTQLVLVSFLLAILPLTAIVIYSYESSRTALESAYRREAARLTRQMDARISAIRGELETRMAGVSALPLQSLPDAAKKQPVVDEVVTAMGDVAPLVDAVEFQPEEVATQWGGGTSPPRP